jgi:hypothetical protein
MLLRANAAACMWPPTVHDAAASLIGNPRTPCFCCTSAPDASHYDNFLRSRYQDPFKRASPVRTRSLYLLQHLQKPPFCNAGAVSMALVALSVAHSDDGHFEKFTMPQPTWYTEAPLEASNSRSLQAATASCVIRITGTGAPQRLRDHSKPGRLPVTDARGAA